LKAFAARQVALVREGWLIVHAEEEAEETRGELSVQLVVDGESIELLGRIDRIDFHEANRAIRVLDYKTADTAQTPDKTHRNSEGWTDLQLPLYRHLWRAAPLNVPADCTVELGYFNLPKQFEETKVAVASWDAATLEGADERAREVIRNLRNAIFWPPAYPAPDYSEDFAAICLDNLYSQPRLLDENHGGEA